MNDDEKSITEITMEKVREEWTREIRAELGDTRIELAMMEQDRDRCLADRKELLEAVMKHRTTFEEVPVADAALYETAARIEANHDSLPHHR